MAVAEKSRHHNRDAELAILHERTQALNLYEFWSVNEETEHEAVNNLQKFTKAQPHIWKYADVFPCLEKAGAISLGLLMR